MLGRRGPGPVHPQQGLGNSAIAAAVEEQLERLGNTWAAMAITDPAGSDSGAIRTTATKDGDDYIINGEKIYITAGERADAIVVWASLDRSKGKAAIKSVVEKGTPGTTLERLEKKPASALRHRRHPLRKLPGAQGNLLGSPEISVDKGFAGAMQTFDNTRPVVAGMAIESPAPPWKNSGKSSAKTASTSATKPRPGPNTPSPGNTTSSNHNWKPQHNTP